MMLLKEYKTNQPPSKHKHKTQNIYLITRETHNLISHSLLPQTSKYLYSILNSRPSSLSSTSSPLILLLLSFRKPSHNPTVYSTPSCMYNKLPKRTSLNFSISFRYVGPATLSFYFTVCIRFFFPCMGFGFRGIMHFFLFDTTLDAHRQRQLNSYFRCFIHNAFPVYTDESHP